ncbi:hypothetical protein [Paraburkholderia sp. J8-2]|uniref:hypothetical protein n=1 Tax=Paraburkholderia sp. J8-2 TaxID=2805440 RepID=UPI002AB787F0|nr:hypothetical protein [Paraburkholderia sp. J8-2]
MKSKLEHAALHAKGLAVAVMHLLVHGHTVEDPEGDLLWSIGVDISPETRIEVRLMPDHRYGVRAVSAATIRWGEPFEVLDTAVLHVLHWREQLQHLERAHQVEGANEANALAILVG